LEFDLRRPGNPRGHAGAHDRGARHVPTPSPRGDTLPKSDFAIDLGAANVAHLVDEGVAWVRINRREDLLLAGRQALEWVRLWNENPRPSAWTKTADQILESAARYCMRTSETGR